MILVTVIVKLKKSRFMALAYEYLLIFLLVIILFFNVHHHGFKWPSFSSSSKELMQICVFVKKKTFYYVFFKICTLIHESEKVVDIS